MISFELVAQIDRLFSAAGCSVLPAKQSVRDETSLKLEPLSPKQKADSYSPVTFNTCSDSKFKCLFMIE